MSDERKRNDGKPGTTDEWPRWEGPQENRPRGYRPPKDDPKRNPDSVGETLEESERSGPSEKP
ncbi:hypothetical protein N1F89_02535 [Aquibium sp. A9E412]|uniref:hypothetical protein n=1 Tax=Aquibium sp. A9E412 TaxID=2976767 RepID=UPI0025AF0E96|nr:hypothetical protein [Aquibium sp. A9E412]MDN2565086.1 hypothetical protein [Aquibium sp. A9E412]